MVNGQALASSGSVLATQLAMEKGWGINLGGGFAHAKRSRGSGFCLFPDTQMMVDYARLWYGITKVLILDLDAH